MNQPINKAEEWISELEDRLVKSLQQTKIKKNEKKGGQSKDPLDIKYTKIHFTGIWEREEREKRPEKYLKR